VRLLTTWQGEGRLAWSSNGRLKLANFALPPELAARLVFAMDTGGLGAPKALRRAIAHLDTVIGPLLEDVFGGLGERRIEAVGPIGLLPVLATSVAGRVLGSSPEIANRHPNTDAVLRAGGMRTPIDLLVIDACFEGEASRVQSALREFQSTHPTDCRVLAFNSRPDGHSLSASELGDALQSASSAMLFCHSESNLTHASGSGLVLGPSSIFTVEELAALDLRGLSELAVISCASGRSNPFVGEVTPAHAAAVAGAGEILYTLWPIRPSSGSRFAVGVIEARSQGRGMGEFLADEFEADRVRAASFAILRS
jgi:hypothetical protein